MRISKIWESSLYYWVLEISQWSEDMFWLFSSGIVSIICLMILYLVGHDWATELNWTMSLLLLLLSRVSHVWLCGTPETSAYQALLSLGFSRQEHWSVLPFPSPMHESEKWKWSHSFVSDSTQPHGLRPTRLLRPWDFPGKSTGVGCHCLLQIHITYYSSIRMYNSMAFGTFTGLSNYHNSGLWKFRIFTSPQKETLYSLTVTLLFPVPQLLEYTCCCSVSQSCLTLCESMNCSTPDSLSITISLSLLRLMSIESVMPSNHLFLCCPLLLLPSVFASIRIFFQWVGSSHQVAKVLGSFSFSISHWKDWCWHTLVCFFSMDLPTLDISYKWNHTIWGLLYLASFT